MNTAAISAITALVAVILSPIISIYVAKKQFGASVLSKFRQEWINSLRDNISEYISCMFMIMIYNRTSEIGQGKEIAEECRKLVLLNHKISLMLNPNEENHNKLIKLLEGLTAVVAEEDRDKSTANYKEKSNDIVVLSQIILKEEWIRVKKGN